MYSRLKGLMAESNITQEELSKLLGISITALNFKINCKRDFTIKEGKRICKIFNKTLDEIFFTE